MTREGVASIERPILNLRVLLFLQENHNATLSDMISNGWNRRTLEASLLKLGEFGLLKIETHRSFPRFEKKYVLTGEGEYIANFVNHLEENLKARLGCGMEDLSTFPKGCMPILTHVLRQGWCGISKILKDLDISPNQAYRCLAFMRKKGILCKEEGRIGKLVTSSYSLSDNGVHMAVALDALDKALRMPSRIR